MDFEMLLGLFMFYVWGHFFVIQFQRNWDNRSVYEKFLTKVKRHSKSPNFG